MPIVFLAPLESQYQEGLEKLWDNSYIGEAMCNTGQGVRAARQCVVNLERCIYATYMSTASVLLRQARANAGLSCTALAARAGVPTSTVSRIEADAMDPTVVMLTRVMAAAGCRLELNFARVAPAPNLADLTSAWIEGSPD